MFLSPSYRWQQHLLQWVPSKNFTVVNIVNRKSIGAQSTLQSFQTDDCDLYTVFSFNSFNINFFLAISVLLLPPHFKSQAQKFLLDGFHKRARGSVYELDRQTECQRNGYVTELDTIKYAFFKIDYSISSSLVPLPVL